MSDSDSVDSERKRDQKKRRRRGAEDDDASSERSYKQKKKKHRHKDRKKKSKKKLKDSSRKCTSSRKRSASLVQTDEQACLRPNSESLPSNKNNGIGQPEEIQQQLRKHEQALRMAPMSREEYQAQQSTIREIYDEQTGRYRLVRGTGEIIESLVSRSQHETINQQATRGDGASFSRDIFRAANR